MEEGSKKPPFLFTGLLFIYFYEITLSSITVMYNIWTWGLKTITQSPVPYSYIFYIVFLAGYIIYTTIGITGALRGERWSISALRSSLVLASVMLLQTPIALSNNTNNIWIYSLVCFNVLFLLYTIFSKKLRRLIPIRKRETLGWIGLLLALIAIIPISITSGSKYLKTKSSIEVALIDNINLSGTQNTDGLSIFCLNKDWQLDSISFSEHRSFVKDQTSNIEICTSNTDVWDQKHLIKLDYYNSISAYATREGFDSQANLIRSCDTIVSGNILFISSYNCQRDSLPKTMTYATLYSKETYKKISMCWDIGFEDLGKRYQDIYEFMETVDFNIKGHLVK